jgi:hypothetical protein
MTLKGADFMIKPSDVGILNPKNRLPTTPENAIDRTVLSMGWRKKPPAHFVVNIDALHRLGIPWEKLHVSTLKQSLEYNRHGWQMEWAHTARGMTLTLIPKPTESDK